MEEDTAAVFTVTGIGSGDPGQSLRFIASPATAPVSALDVLSFDPVAGIARVKLALQPNYPALHDQPRSGTFTLNVDDGQQSGYLKSATATVTILPINDPPTLNAIANPPTRSEDGPAFAVNLAGITADGGENGQTLTVTAVSSGGPRCGTADGGAVGGRDQRRPRRGVRPGADFHPGQQQPGFVFRAAGSVSGGRPHLQARARKGGQRRRHRDLG
jgi:hypothetical protein